MAARLFQGHGEAGGCHRGGAHGRAPVLLSEVGFGGRDGLLDSQGLSSALYYWVCSAVHFQPGEYWVDHSGVPFHGWCFFSTCVWLLRMITSFLSRKKVVCFKELEKGFLGVAEIVFQSLQICFGRGLIV